MARYQKGKGYKQQSADYINSFTRDEFKAQKQMNKRRKAGERLMSEKGVTRMRDLDQEDRIEFRQNNDLSYIGDAREEGSQYFKKGNLRNLTEDNNPFNRSNKEGEIEYAGDEYGRGAQKGRELLTVGDFRALKNIGGRTLQEIDDFSKKTDAKISANAQDLLGRWRAAIIEAENENDGGGNPPPPGTAPGIDDIDTETDFDNTFSDISDVTQGDVTATFGDNAINLGDIGNKSTIYNQFPSGDGTGGYESFLTNAAMNINQNEDFFNENSGMKYGTGAVLVADALRKKDRPVNWENAYKDSDRFTNMMLDMGNYDLAQMYGTPVNYQVTDFVMPEDLEDPVDRLKRGSEFLQGLV